MKYFIYNANVSLRFCLTAFKVLGFWPPTDLEGGKLIFYRCYTVFSFIFLMGIYLVTQAIALVLIWGDISLMIGITFILFTNLAETSKILNLLLRRRAIQKIIEENHEDLMRTHSEGGRSIVKSCNRNTSIQQLFCFVLAVITTGGFAISTKKNTLPLPAWYPYDTSASPAFELTYTYQTFVLLLCAYLNVGLDTMFTSLVAQCRCRLELVGHNLRTLGEGISITNKMMLTPEQEKLLSKRLKHCLHQHEAALQSARQLQDCFSEPILAQFSVSTIIICGTAYQLAFEAKDLSIIIPMITYLMSMLCQVYYYCYEGNEISETSSKIAGAVYLCPWYACSVKLRRALLVVSIRSRRVVRLTAGGITTLSLETFMGIIKTSYSMFTLLEQVNEKKQIQ